MQQAAPHVQADGITLVLSGDVPLTQSDTLQALVAACAGERMALLTVDLADPTGYGRIVRAEPALDQVQAIVEHKDATAAQRDLREIYSGIMAVPTALLKQTLALLDNENAQQEFYLTDVVKHAVALGASVVAVKTTDAAQVAGVNSPVQLQALERE